MEVDYSVWAKSDRIYLNFLPALDDLTRGSTYGWGRFVLGWMYSNMGDMANREKAMFLGLHFLWEVRCLKNFVFVVSFVIVIYFVLSYLKLILVFYRFGVMRGCSHWHLVGRGRLYFPCPVSRGGRPLTLTPRHGSLSPCSDGSWIRSLLPSKVYFKFFLL